MSQIKTALRSQLQRARTSLMIGIGALDRARRRKAARDYLSVDASVRLVNGDAAEQMRSDGFAHWRISPATARSLIASYQATCAERAAGSSTAVERTTGKAFFQETVGREDFVAHSAYVRAALEPELLATVTAATGLVPHLASVQVYVSHPQESHGLTASQLWHRDVNDKMTVKLFVYLEDVGEPNGPFTFIPAPHSARVPSDLPHYITDEKIDEYVGRDSWQSVAGPAGTAFLVDTRRCLHYGSRCTSPRVAYIATFSSGLRYSAVASEWSAVLGTHEATLDPLQRMVSGISKVGSFSH